MITNGVETITVPKKAHNLCCMTRHRTCNNYNTVTSLKLYSLLKGESIFRCHHFKHLDIFAYVAGARKKTFHPSKPGRRRLPSYIVKYITEENTVLISYWNKLFKCWILHFLTLISNALRLAQMLHWEQKHLTWSTFFPLVHSTSQISLLLVPALLKWVLQTCTAFSKLYFLSFTFHGDRPYGTCQHRGAQHRNPGRGAVALVPPRYHNSSS